MIRLALSNGHQILRTCGATCWKAKGDACRCICGGALHGIRRNGADPSSEDVADLLELGRRNVQREARKIDSFMGLPGESAVQVESIDAAQLDLDLFPE
jgi:hypothetical protein